MNTAEVLVCRGLNAFSSAQELKDAYRSWLLAAHPDEGGETRFYVRENAKWSRLQSR